MRLLYVEDSESLRDTVARGLRKAGYAVDAVADGNEGLDLASSGIYDVVILDLMLPGRGGLEVLRELRASGIDSEVLLLTAKAMVSDRVAGLECGADDYLVKPFAFDELLARLRALLRRRYGSKSDRVAVGALEIEMGAGRGSICRWLIPTERFAACWRNSREAWSHRACC